MHRPDQPSRPSARHATTTAVEVVGPFLLPAVIGAIWWWLLTGTTSLLAPRSLLFMPDRYETLLAGMAAGDADQFSGAWSRIGLAHPGPAWFWWTGPFLRLTGSNPAALAVAAAVLAATCLTAIVIRVHRSTDLATALVAAAALVIGVRQLSIPGLVMPWNPTVLIVPLALALVCLADVCDRGSLTSIIVAVVCGSFVAQCHLGAFAVGTAVVAAALAAGWWRRRSLPRRSTTTARWEVMAVGAVLLVVWLPVAVDQVAVTGNATKVATYLVTGRVDGEPAADDGPTRRLSTIDALREVASVVTLSTPHTALWAGSDIAAGRAHRPGLRSDLVMLMLLALAVWGAALRRRSPASGGPAAVRRAGSLGAWLCRVGLVALGLTVVGAVRIAPHYRPYLIASGAGVGLALWVGTALVAVARLRTRLPSLSTRPIAATAVAATVVALALTPTAVVGFSTLDTTVSIDELVQVGRQRGVALRADDADLLQPQLQLTWLLEARGVRVAADGPLDAHFSDRQRTAAPHDPVRVTLTAPDAPLPEGCTPLGKLAERTICAVP